MNLPPHPALSPAAGERESGIQRWLIFRGPGLINADECDSLSLEGEGGVRGHRFMERIGLPRIPLRGR
jgi:hypothetical protein